MKNIILNTKEADEISADRKNYKYYFKKPIIVKDENTLSLQSISQRSVVQTSSTPDTTGLLHLSSFEDVISGGTPSSYGWTLNAGGFVEEMTVDLTNSAEAIVVANDGFTLKTAGVDYNGGIIKCLIFNDTDNQKKLVISSVVDMGSGYEAGWYLLIKKRPAGVTYTGSYHPTFYLLSVKDSLIYQDGYFFYQESIGSFEPIIAGYTGEVNVIDADFTSSNTNIGQGLIVKFNTTNANPSSIEVSSISSGGYGFEVGTYIYINKKDFLPSTSGTDFLLPLKLQVATNIPIGTAQPVYDEGLLTIGNISIDDTTIPSSIYGSFNYVGEWTVSLDDNGRCSVFRANGGASVGSGAVIKFFTFIDYGTAGFPKTTKIAQVISFGKNYQVGDYVIINQTAFPAGYVTGTVNMRVNINDVVTSTIVDFPKGVILTLSLDGNYSGLEGGQINYTHSTTTDNGQNSQFIWGSNSSAIELKEIVNGGNGFVVGDIFWVSKNDALFTSTTYFSPFKVEVVNVSSLPPPPPPSLDSGFKIVAKNLLYDFGNITSSTLDTNILIYNKENTLFGDRDQKKFYKICDLHNQVLMGVELFIESPVGLPLNTTDKLILHLKIS